MKSQGGYVEGVAFSLTMLGVLIGLFWLLAGVGIGYWIWGVLSLAALGMFAFGVDQSVRWSAVVVRKVETVSLLGVLSHQFFCALLLAFFALCAFILKLQKSVIYLQKQNGLSA